MNNYSIDKSIVVSKNLDSLHARLNSHYKAWSYKKRSKKRLRSTGNLFKKNLQIKGVC